MIGGALYYVFTNLNAMVEAAIEKYGSQTTKTAVQADKVKIQLTDGAGAISGLSIANPKGFETENAFSLGAIETQIDIKSLTKGPITIDKVIVRKPQIFYELNNDRQSNLNELYKNIAASTGGSSGTSKPAAKGDEPKLIIRRFELADATVEANVVPLNKKYTLKLPAIEMRDLGGKNGATPSEISRQMLDTITQRALAAVKQAGIDDRVQAVKSAAREKVGTKTREAESRTKEKLKNVLGK
ncbi:MAG: hypothetical protein ACJ8LN_10070 [Sulfurifustis sp.]